MKRAAQERHVSPDGLAAGQSADGLVDHGLENRSGQVFLGGTVIDQRLNIGLGKYAAAGRRERQRGRGSVYRRQDQKWSG